LLPYANAVEGEKILLKLKRQKRMIWEKRASRKKHRALREGAASGETGAPFGALFMSACSSIE